MSSGLETFGLRRLGRRHPAGRRCRGALAAAGVAPGDSGRRDPVARRRGRGSRSGWRPARRSASIASWRARRRRAAVHWQAVGLLEAGNRGVRPRAHVAVRRVLQVAQPDQLGLARANHGIRPAAVGGGGGGAAARAARSRAPARPCIHALREGVVVLLLESSGRSRCRWRRSPRRCRPRTRHRSPRRRRHCRPRRRPPRPGRRPAPWSAPRRRPPAGSRRRPGPAPDPPQSPCSSSCRPETRRSVLPGPGMTCTVGPMGVGAQPASIAARQAEMTKCPAAERRTIIACLSRQNSVLKIA